MLEALTKVMVKRSVLLHEQYNMLDILDAPSRHKSDGRSCQR